MKELLSNLKKLKGAQALLLLLFVCVFGCLTLTGGQDSAAKKTELEARTEAVLSKIAGAGEVSVVIYSQETTETLGKTVAKNVGAVIVARGASDPAVRIKLISAAQTLLSLPANAIEVFEMEAAK